MPHVTVVPYPDTTPTKIRFSAHIEVEDHLFSKAVGVTIHLHSTEKDVLVLGEEAYCTVFGPCWIEKLFGVTWGKKLAKAKAHLIRARQRQVEETNEATKECNISQI